MRGGIAVVNVSSLSQACALAMVDAVAEQVRRDFAPAWSRLPCYPSLYARVEDVPGGMPRLLLVDDSDQADALGYHTEGGDGSITGIVAAEPVLAAGGDPLTGALSVSSVLSHEVLEVHVDPFVDVWIDGPDGRMWAFEVADPVQGSSYEIGGVAVSNFVLPPFFDERPPVGSRFDHLGELSAPFTLGSGGYAVVRPRGGAATQIGLRPAWRVPHPSGRAIRRAA